MLPDRTPKRGVPRLLMLVATALGLLAPAAGSAVPVDAAPVLQAWDARYMGPRNHHSEPKAVVISPDNESVYVTGFGEHNGAGDFATVAYDLETGSMKWSATYDSGGDRDGANDLALSLDGARLYVVGRQGRDFGAGGYAVVAYETSTGTKQWVSTYQGPGHGDDWRNDFARAVALSPDGARLYVTGASRGVHTGMDYATIAFDTATGEQLWVSRYASPAEVEDDAFDIAVSPNGDRVFLTGTTVTICYDVSDGSAMWSSEHPGAGAQSRLVVSPDGANVYVAAGSTATAFDADNGTRRWVAPFDPVLAVSRTTALALSPDGLRLFVTGSSFVRKYTTAAYDTGTGEHVWLARHSSSSGSDVASAIAVSGDGAYVYVTGAASEVVFRDWHDYGTVAYHAETGVELWMARFDGGAIAPIQAQGGQDAATALAVSPDGSRVVVTGRHRTAGFNNEHYATVAYCTLGSLEEIGSKCGYAQPIR